MKIDENKPLGQASTQELRNLLAQREEEERQKANDALILQFAFVHDNIDLVLQLFSEHSRMGCSDKEPHNWGPEYEPPRCNRCRLLKIKKDDYNDNIVLEAELYSRRLK